VLFSVSLFLLMIKLSFYYNRYSRIQLYKFIGYFEKIIKVFCD